jgi:single-stranded DNA-binding protein
MNESLGENFVTLVGKISKKDYKLVGQNNLSLLKGTLAIPTPNGAFQYVKIAAWHGNAEALNELKKGVFVKIHGHIEESSFDGKCRYCKAPEKKYWTEVVIDNFIVMESV